MTPAVVRWLSRAGLIGGAALVLAGCPDDPSEIVEPIGGTVWNFPVTSGYVAPEAPFAVNRLALAGFNVDLDDAFGRSTGVLGTFNEDNAFAFPAYSMDTFGRNGSTDPRLPLLQDDDAGVDRFCVLGSPPFAGVGEGFWDLFCEVTGLDPNTRYTVMMVRYSLTVNGQLDHEQAALGQAVDEPDELVVFGGSPGGFPDVACDFTAGVPVQSNVNPFVVGFIDTDANGDATIDCLPLSTAADPTWWRNFDEELPAGVEDSIPFGPNTGADGIDLTIPSYNYLVLVEGQGTALDPVPAGPPVVRWQVGNDVDADGNGINNAVAPFPLPLSVAELVGAPGGAGRPDSLTVTFNDLEELASGASYTAWLFNENTGDIIPAVGTYNKIAIVADRDPITGDIVSTADSLAETVPSADGFVGGGVVDERVVGFRHQMVISDATLPGGATDSVGFYTHLLLSVDDAPGDGAPSSATPFFFQFTDQSETPLNFFDDAFTMSGTATFGNIDLSMPSNVRVYNGSGSGTGGFRGDDELSVNMETMSRPPVGYQLVAWLIPDDGGAPFRLPDITGPPPDRVDLTNADVSTDADVVTATGILEANFRVLADQAGIDFANFSSFVITIEPKAGIAVMGPIPVYAGTVPPNVAEGG